MRPRLGNPTGISSLPPREDPRGPQEAPKKPLRGPKRPPTPARGPKRPPRTPQEASKRLLEAPGKRPGDLHEAQNGSSRDLPETLNDGGRTTDELRLKWSCELVKGCSLLEAKRARRARVATHLCPGKGPRGPGTGPPPSSWGNRRHGDHLATRRPKMASNLPSRTPTWP